MHKSCLVCIWIYEEIVTIMWIKIYQMSWTSNIDVQMNIRSILKTTRESYVIRAKYKIFISVAITVVFLCKNA